MNLDAQKPILEARDLTLSWDGEHTVVHEFSLSLEQGESVALVGRSGSGKTTLLHALAGLIRPDAGTIMLMGHDITGKPGHVGYMQQKDLLLPSKRVVDNVCLPLLLRGISRKEAHEKALPLIERFGLAEVARSWPYELSGGMRQRAAFLRTYLTGAQVMLLDEPFSALDALTRQEMRLWFKKMGYELNISTLIITHDVEEACAMGSRVLVLAGAPSKGIPSKIVAELPPSTAPEKIICLLG